MVFAKIYLISYNVLQFVGWSILMWRMAPHLNQFMTPSKSFYNEVGGLLRCVQTAMFLEVFHAASGLVRSNPVLTAVQITSRSAVLWSVVHHIEVVQTSIGLPLMLFAWTLTEIIRYSYYTLNLMNTNVGIITWLRYTLFIVLYPIGVTGELLCYYFALPKIGQTKLFSIELPNAWNFSFNFYLVVIFVMVSYIPVFPQLYFHMFGLRKKVLGNDSKKKAA